MKHIKLRSKPASASLNRTIFGFCWPDPSVATDGNCYGLIIDDGVLGISITGGWIQDRFIPLSKG